MTTINKNTIIDNCRLCKAPGDLTIYKVSPSGIEGNEIVICPVCLAELSGNDKPNSHYWRFLTEAMWSEIQAVQVLAWRILNRLKDEDWVADCLDQLYLNEETLAWAKADTETAAPVSLEVHRDSLGNELNTGDTVVLTRTLDVKGSSLNAKMGTVVKNIRLVIDNTDQIEGKIDGQVIVILNKYLRKQKS
jgi:protein PhnA